MFGVALPAFTPIGGLPVLCVSQDLQHKLKVAQPLHRRKMLANIRYFKAHGCVRCVVLFRAVSHSGSAWQSSDDGGARDQEQHQQPERPHPVHGGRQQARSAKTRERLELIIHPAAPCPRSLLLTEPIACLLVDVLQASFAFRVGEVVAVLVPTASLADA